MKKLLALVLALTMLLGLATVGSSAAYADQDDINYEEAVDVMSAIGVLAGDETGFRPTDTLKRSEGAKIVAYLMVGNKTAEALQGTGTKYTDLPANHWASGYMEYLSTAGVMGGIGDGKIDPDGQLTATAFAKMLLVALGYNAEVEGFGGADWAINVQKVANTVGLFDGNNAVVGSAAVTREEAALYAFNTLLTPIVEYDSLVRVSNTDGGIVTVGNNKAEYVTTAKASDQSIFTDRASNNQFLVEFAERYYPDLKLDGNDYTQDDMGRPVHTWINKSAKVGTYAAKKALVYTWTGEVTAKKVYDVVGKTIYDELTRASNPTTLSSFKNGAVQALYVSGAAAIDPYVNRTNTTKVNGSGNGTVTELYMDEDSNLCLVSYETYLFQAAADYNSTNDNLRIKAAGDTAITLGNYVLSGQDFDIKDYKADDYILVTAYTNYTGTAAYSVDTIAKAETLTGTVDAVKVNSNVTIDGTAYSYNNTTLSTGGNANVKATAYSVGQATTVVLDKYGYIIAVDEAVVNQNYVFIAQFGSTSGLNTNTVAAAYFTDGTKDTITVKEAYNAAGTKVSATQLMSGTGAKANTAVAANGILGDGTGDQRTGYAGWYTFSKDSDGKYTLYAPKATDNWLQTIQSYTNNGADVTNNNKVLFAGNSNSDDGASYVLAGTPGTGIDTILRANDKTVFIVLDKTGTADDVYVYTGVKNTPDISTATTAGSIAVLAALYKSTSNYASYVFVTAEGDSSIYDGSNEALLYVEGLEGTYRRTNNEQYFKWRVLDENATFVTKDATVTAPTTWQAVYRVRTNADDELTQGIAITGTAITASTNVAAGTYTGKYFNLGTAFNGKTATGAAAATSGKIGYSNNTLWMGNQAFTLADDAKLVLVLQKTANALMTNKNADREAYIVSASELATRLEQYPNATYTVQGRVDDNFGTGDRLLHEAYITVSNAAATTTTAANTTYIDADDYSTETAFTNAVNVALTSGRDVVVTNSSVVLNNTNTITIPAGRTLTFSGDLINNNATFNNKGMLVIDGNLTDNGHIALTGSANLTVNGTTVTIGGSSITATANTTILFTYRYVQVTVTGNLKVAGKLEIGAVGTAAAKQDADLFIDDGATVEFESTAAVTVQGDITVDSAATSVTNATDNFVVTNNADVDHAVAGSGTILAASDTGTTVLGAVTTGDTDLYAAISDLKAKYDEIVAAKDALDARVVAANAKEVSAASLDTTDGAVYLARKDAEKKAIAIANSITSTNTALGVSDEHDIPAWAATQTATNTTAKVATLKSGLQAVYDAYEESVTSLEYTVDAYPPSTSEAALLAAAKIVIKGGSATSDQKQLTDAAGIYANEYYVKADTYLNGIDTTYTSMKDTVATYRSNLDANSTWVKTYYADYDAALKKVTGYMTAFDTAVASASSIGELEKVVWGDGDKGEALMSYGVALETAVSEYLKLGNTAKITATTNDAYATNYDAIYVYVDDAEIVIYGEYSVSNDAIGKSITVTLKGSNKLNVEDDATVSNAAALYNWTLTATSNTEFTVAPSSITVTSENGRVTKTYNIIFYYGDYTPGG